MFHHLPQQLSQMGGGANRQIKAHQRLVHQTQAHRPMCPPQHLSQLLPPLLVMVNLLAVGDMLEGAIHHPIPEMQLLPRQQMQRIQVLLLLPILIHPVSVLVSARLP